ncbi:MAG: cytochrome c oxidase subunit 3 [Vicingaceae bacterium]
MDDQYSLSEKDFQEEKRKKVAKPLVWFGMASIVMLFAGLTSAVIVRKGDGSWNSFEMPSMFLWSTIIIAISSLTFILGAYFAKKDKPKQVKLFIGLTLLLGILFIYMQFLGYNQLMANNVFLTGPGSNASGSFLYIISFLHILHLLGGMVALSIVFFNALKEQYNSKNLLGLQVCSTYWHFMGGMWLYLYIFFKLII